VNEAERFHRSYRVDAETDCWLWVNSLDSFGAGRMRYHGRLTQAHRVALLLAGVELDPRREVAASCGLRHCVNPSHLSQVVQSGNPARRLTYLSQTNRRRTRS
jgi:hypothetical protein